MLNMTLHFKFTYNHKNYSFDNLNSPPNYVFTQKNSNVPIIVVVKFKVINCNIYNDGSNERLWSFSYDSIDINMD